MMTLTQAEIEIYKRIGQFADRSKYLIGARYDYRRQQ